MPISSFDIRICRSCGLRYPLIEGHPFGIRCPHCLGETQVVINRKLGDSEVMKEVKSGKKEVMKAVLLDNIRSAWNVGSILRSADGFGFSHAYLCGITPTPEVDRSEERRVGKEC
jgi:23S rRNA (guanosine2251-2'-O)-methyltransferase